MSTNIQARFDAVKPMTPLHLLADNEVATASNIDFGLGAGGLLPRRGQLVFGTVTAGGTITTLFRNYNVPDNIGACPFYASDAAGNVYRGSGASWTQIGSGFGQGAAVGAYQQYALIGAAGQTIKDDGTHTTDWIKQVPGTPSITVNTLAGLDLTFGGTYAIDIGVFVDGTSTFTFQTDASSNIAQISVDYGGSQDLNSNGTNSIKDFGIHFVDLAFDVPGNVTRISQDYSVGDSNFYNYWHVELTPQQSSISFFSPTGFQDPAQANPNILIDSQLNVGTFTSSALSNDQRAQMIAEFRTENRPTISALARFSTDLSPWAVSRPDFGLVGKFTGSDPWADIHAVRWTIECSGPVVGTIGNPEILGSVDFPLNDITVGYTYWQTYATLDGNGNKIGESAPSDPTSPQQMQQSNATVTLVGTATDTGITHIITYRQGGYTRTGYAVNTQTYTAGASFTDTLNDIQALSIDDKIITNIQPKGDSNFADMFAISETYLGRVFYAERNNLHWSLPGQIDAFPYTSFLQVSSSGDNIKGVVVWPPGMVIVNQNSVYEFTGADLESGNFNLVRSATRKGSVAPRTIIKTPYGIPLLSYDGLSIYRPGQGSDEELQWLMQDYGDMFRGSGDGDPAALKGNRIPAINYGYIIDCCAAYAEGRIYLAAPTGTSSRPNTLYVIDIPNHRVWWYVYPFNISALLWDIENNRLLAGTDDGVIMQIEHGQFYLDTDGSASFLTWYAATKQWTTNSDTVMENLSIDAEGDFIEVHATYDNQGTPVITTLTDTERKWYTPPLNGTFANSVYFTFNGVRIPTINNTVYGLNFDLMYEPVKVRYYRTPYDVKGQEADKLWDVGYYDLECKNTPPGLIYAVTFVDHVAVMTYTFTAPWGGREVFEQAFPPETYGRVAVTTYTSSTTTIPFKHWTTYYDSRPEPAKINYWRTDIHSLDENICDAFDVDINPNGTVLGTAYVDNVAVATGTFTGTKRQSYTWTLAEELYGRTLYVAYTGTGLKHYKTWFHLRPEPDRWTSFVSSKLSGPEHEWKTFKPELNCLGNTVLATAYVEGTAVATFTATGSTRQQYTFSLPVRTFGRTVWTAYAVQGTGFFKHYPPPEESPLEYEGDPEPSRVSTYRTGPYPFPSSNYLKTWLPQLDPILGTVYGTLIVDDQVLATASFVGDRKQWFTVGLDVDAQVELQTGSRWEAIYSAGVDDSNPSHKFKHYETKLESEAKPFGKPGWAYSYRKLGGASQVDLARFWSFEAEADLNTIASPVPVEWFWDIDGQVFYSGTTTLTGGVEWFDRIPLPPGGRGYLFLFRCKAIGSGTFKVYKVNLDLAQEGIKGLVRRETPGTPDSNGRPSV